MRKKFKKDQLVKTLEKISLTFIYNQAAFEIESGQIGQIIGSSHSKFIGIFTVKFPINNNFYIKTEIHQNILEKI